MSSKKKTLMKNTIMLYILTFSNYFFGFITVPYQTRILGPEFYGKIGFAMAFATYFQLFLDFGFLLSATEDVSKNRTEKKELGKILTAVNYSKMILITIAVIVLTTICITIPKFRNDYMLYVLYFVYVSINCFLPDFLYRGLEDMKMITYRTVLIKLIFTILIFVFLKNKSQYYLVPIMNILGALVAVIFAYIHVKRKLNIKYQKVNKKYILETLKKSSTFFLSRIATTIYGATNTFILGFIYPTGNVVGLYTGADKLVSTGKSALSPISDSVYPYMVKNKDFKLIKKILLIFMPIIILGCTIIGIFSKEVCHIILGKEFINASNILRLMLPILVITLPNYLLGFPTMSPLGISKYANISVIIGSIIQIVNIIILAIIRKLNIYSICIITIITELSILLIRIYYIFKKTKENRL